MAGAMAEARGSRQSLHQPPGTLQPWPGMRSRGRDDDLRVPAVSKLL